MSTEKGMRLYRGLTRPYRPEEVETRNLGLGGTDFTDCPYTALLYARGRRGVVIVLDVPATEGIGGIQVLEQPWGAADGQRRWMVWGNFDEHLVAEIPAKELRAQINGRGVKERSFACNSQILKAYIDRRIDESDGFTSSRSRPRRAPGSSSDG